MKEIDRLHSRLNQGNSAFTHGPVDNIAAVYDARSVMQDTGQCLYQHDYESDILMPQMVAKSHEFYHNTLRPFLSGKDVNVLDIGCADGSRSRDFLTGLDGYARSHTALGGDISPEMVEVARKRIGNAQVLDMIDMPFRDEFDLIMSMYGVLGHLKKEDSPKALQQVYLALKPGGLAGIDVLAKTEETRRVFEHTDEDEKLGRNYMTYYVFNRQGQTLLNPEGRPFIGTNKWFTDLELRVLCEEAGFEVVAAKTIMCTEKADEYTEILYWKQFYLENAIVVRKPEDEPT